jgi:hypothetical protein
MAETEFSKLPEPPDLVRDLKADEASLKKPRRATLSGFMCRQSRASASILYPAL